MLSPTHRRGATTAIAAAALVACAARATQTSPAAVASPVVAAPTQSMPSPAVGTLAPDFVLRGATRYGVLATPVRLSDYRGQTVVIAFFYKARTKG